MMISILFSPIATGWRRTFRSKATAMTVLLAGGFGVGMSWAGVGVVNLSESGGRPGAASLLVPFFQDQRVTVVFPYPQPPMRLAQENPAARKPPLLPCIVQESKPEAAETGATEADVSAATSSTNVASPGTVNATNPLLEAIDFFRTAGKRAADAPGEAFDPTFRPAVPPVVQPESSATYQVE